MSLDNHPEILPEEKSVFETEQFMKRLWIFVPATCALFAVMNIVLSFLGMTHPHFGWLTDKNPIFYGIWGFASFCFIILAGQHLRKILMRPEGYYDGPEADPESDQ